MNDLSKQNAFNTMQKLSKKLNFQYPKNKDFFTHKLYGDVNALIPLTININGGGNLIFSTTQQLFLREKNMINVSSIFFKEKLLYGLQVYSNDNIKNYDKKLIDLITFHLNSYYNTILQMVDDINSNLINEEQIINYLNNNQELKNQYKTVFKDEVSILQDYAPNILQSWTYYEKFNQ